MFKCSNSEMLSIALVILQNTLLASAFSNVLQRWPPNVIGRPRQAAAQKSRSPLMELPNAKPFDDDYFAVSDDRSRNLLQWIDKQGQSLKPAAAKANAKSSIVEGKWRKVRYHFQSCALYCLFILYRAYRGFFVILPAVFRETFRKMETVVDGNPFDDAEAIDEPPTKTWRTRITVSVLAMVVTASYVLGGALRVFVAMIRGAQRGNIPQSFAAAASEQERNERMLLKRRATKNITGKLE